MTTTVTINAHPAAPMNAVEVTVTQPGQPDAIPTITIMRDAEVAFFHVDGDQELTVGEIESDLISANTGA